MDSADKNELAQLKTRVSKLEEQVRGLLSKASGISPATQTTPNPVQKRNEPKLK
jgi:hypothetical protein